MTINNDDALMRQKDIYVYNESMTGFAIDRIIREYEYSMMTRHIHEEYELYYLCEGERYYFIEQQSYHVSAGDLILIDHGQIHKTGMTESGSHHERILISLHQEPFSTFFSLYGNLDFRNFFKTHAGVIKLSWENQIYIKKLLDSIAAEIQQKHSGYELAAMTKLAELFVMVMRLQPEPTHVPSDRHFQPKYNKVDEVAKYIVEHCTENISLEYLSKTFYINKFYLSRIFKEVTSFTINEFLNETRIKRAHTLLLDTDDSITDISLQLGYDSITYFERVFKKYRGITPLKYRSFYRK